MIRVKDYKLKYENINKERCKGDKACLALIKKMDAFKITYRK